MLHALLTVLEKHLELPQSLQKQTEKIVALAILISKRSIDLENSRGKIFNSPTGAKNGGKNSLTWNHWLLLTYDSGSMTIFYSRMAK